MHRESGASSEKPLRVSGGDLSAASPIGARLALAYVPGLLLLLAVTAAAGRAGVPFADVSRDAIAVLRAPPWIGALSSAGVLVWCAAAAICLHASASANGVRRPFLLHAGLLSALLTLDDLYLLHEVVAPTWLGVRQRYVYVLYAAVTLGFLVWHARFLRASPAWPVLAIALVLLGASMGLDMVPGIPEDAALLEDGAKFLGACGWLAFLAGEARQTLR